ncbi:MAG: hypothetical protein IJ887_00440 [Prevotella sp.]|nr:hypothetical protein [Prevotella sp.]MBR3479292.1 hypothetical protein [Prevotella sp.]
MALCLEGTLTKPKISAKLTAVGLLSASLSHDGLSGSLQHSGLSGSLSRKSDSEASITEQIPFGNCKLSSKAGAKAELSHKGFAKAELSCNRPSANLTARLGTKAILHAPNFLNASLKRKGIDGYFAIFCPIDYLVACFSMGGWNNDAGWDNDEGWCND